jgi:hypothetical protein
VDHSFYLLPPVPHSLNALSLRKRKRLVGTSTRTGQREGSECQIHDGTCKMFQEFQGEVVRVVEFPWVLFPICGMLLMKLVTCEVKLLGYVSSPMVGLV